MNTSQPLTRDQLAAEIVKHVTRRNLHGLIPVQADGVAHFVAALDTDTIAETTNRVVMLGGNATVFVLRTETGKLETFQCTAAKGALNLAAGNDLHEIHEVITMGQFADYLNQRREPTAVRVTKGVPGILTGTRTERDLTLSR